MKLSHLITAASTVLLAACAARPPVPMLATDASATLAATATVASTVTSAATATLAATVIPTPLATIRPEAAAYLEAALDLMEENGINRLQVDWPAMRAIAGRLAASAGKPSDTYAAIRYVLRAAGGRHSFFLTPTEAAEWDQVTVADTPPPRAKLLLDRLGYVAVEGVLITNSDEAAEYATLVQQLIRDLDAQAPCGWIVDLRENTGGNMYPMLAGLGPILGEGVAGEFEEPLGYTTQWSYRDGQSFYGDEGVTRVTGPAYHLQAAHPPVGVLIGPKTASSGEAMVISFRGRPDTRSFGHSTAGLSTGNAGFPLSDGAVIFLTTAVMADRTGQDYGTYIEPDEVIDQRQSTLIHDEAIPQPAVDWLLAQPACMAEA
jgi:carboxyl-terminal processing protease